MPTLSVKVKPNAREALLIPLPDGTYLAQVKAPPVEGKANEAVVALIAGHFKVPRSSVSIKSGAASRLKRVVVQD